MELALTLEKWEKDIQEGRNMGLIGFLKIGRAISAIHDGNLYLTAGCRNIEEYGEKVHGLRKSSIYNAMSIWETWGTYILAHPELQGVDPTRLVRLLPLIDGKDHHELLHMAATVPDAKAFENNIKNLNGKPGTDECKHAYRPIQMEKCAHCNHLRKVVE